MPKHSKKQKQPQDTDEVEDIMAWGNRKENFYQQSEEEYSSSGEEEQEAQRLYERQIQQMGHQDLYQLPQADDYVQEQEEDEDDQQQAVTGLSQQYLTKEIARTAKLGLKISEQADSSVRATLQTHIQGYLMALISLKQLKIPYIEHHPLFNKTIEMKQDIAKLKRLLDSSTVQDNEELGEEEIEDQLEEGDQLEGKEDHDEDQMESEPEEEKVNLKQNKKNGKNRETDDNIAKGLEMYEQSRQKQKAAKQIVKEQRRQGRQSTKKPAFLQVNDNEGRLASEKILKNKGLLKKRKKIDRNSRVKLRRKFDKASSKRRAYGHVIRQNPGRGYEGQKNIRYGRIASVKLK